MKIRHLFTLMASAILLAIGIRAAAQSTSQTASGGLIPLEVAYAGSMGSVMDGPIRTAVRSLGIELRGRAQGSMALARLIEGGSIQPDVFISVTPPPMRV